MSGQEIFELTLLGGAVERDYRRAQPVAEMLAWDELRHEGDVRERACARVEWMEAALQEYASAAMCTRTLNALLRLRAPLDLCAVLGQFPVDELGHAELCARVADALGGNVTLLYDPSLRTPDDDVSLHSRAGVSASIVGDLCIRESWSHALIQELARGSRHPLLRALWSAIEPSERRHAAFGWQFLDWLLPDSSDEERVRLARVAATRLSRLRAALEAVERLPASALSTLGIVGSLGPAVYVATIRRAVERRILAPLARRGLAVT